MRLHHMFVNGSKALFQREKRPLRLDQRNDPMPPYRLSEARCRAVFPSENARAVGARRGIPLGKSAPLRRAATVWKGVLRSGQDGFS
jgi:hypothetical protein